MMTHAHNPDSMPDAGQRPPFNSGSRLMRHWDKVRTFYIVANSGSFTHAAKILNLSQSSISRSVSILEDYLGVTLFNRLARGIALTSEGKMLYEAAGTAFYQLQTAEILLYEGDKPEGILTVATMASSWLLSCLAGFTRQFANLRLHVHDLGDKDDSLSADVILGAAEHVPHAWIKRPLEILEFHLYATSSYLHEHPPIRCFQDITKHVLFLPDEKVWPLAWQDQEKPLATLSLPSLGDLRTLAAGNRGLALLPGNGMQCEEFERLEVFCTPPSLSLYYGYPPRLKASPRVTRFYEYLCEALTSR